MSLPLLSLPVDYIDVCIHRGSKDIFSARSHQVFTALKSGR
jgi:hypothetical protein